jgi:hypothetical protein
VNPTITVGGQNATVQFAGLAAGFAGLAQFNFQMPPAVSGPPVQPLVLAFGTASDTVNINVATSTVPTGPQPVFTAGPIPAGCAPPVTSSRFENTTPLIYAYVTFSNAKVGDRIEWDWYDPTGAAFVANLAINFEGGGCAWSPVTFAGNANASKLGTWRSYYFYNGAFQSGNSFQLTGGN